MKPMIHAKISSKKYGGTIDDYMEIHTFIDESKSHIPDVRHRALLHSSWGIFLVERIFGAYITNSDGELVATRDIAEDHVKEDMGGVIPTVEKWLRNMPIEDWMMGHTTRNSKKTLPADKNWEDLTVD